jgi:hypothetical protein
MARLHRKCKTINASSRLYCPPQRSTTSRQLQQLANMISASLTQLLLIDAASSCNVFATSCSLPSFPTSSLQASSLQQPATASRLNLSHSSSPTLPPPESMQSQL